MGGEKSVCDIYGIEHLLRLFGEYIYNAAPCHVLLMLSILVQIPSLISHANVDVDTLNLLRDAFSDILR